MPGLSNDLPNQSSQECSAALRLKNKYQKFLGLNRIKDLQAHNRDQVQEFWMRRTKEAVFIGITTNLWNIYLESVNLFLNYDRLYMVF